jgi:hypothetical protein
MATTGSPAGSLFIPDFEYGGKVFDVTLNSWRMHETNEVEYHTRRFPADKSPMLVKRGNKWHDLYDGNTSDNDEIVRALGKALDEYLVISGKLLPY